MNCSAPPFTAQLAQGLRGFALSVRNGLALLKRVEPQLQRKQEMCRMKTHLESLSVRLGVAFIVPPRTVTVSFLSRREIYVMFLSLRV